MLNLETMALLVGSGHSRIPIWEGTQHNIRGILIVKSLIVVDPNDCRTVASLGLRMPLVVDLKYPLMDLLKEFQTGRSHIAIVCSDPKALKAAWRENTPVPANVHMAGIITMEDVVEELLQSEIYDEADVSVRETLADVAFKSKRIQRLREIVRDWQDKIDKRSKPSSKGVLRQIANRYLGSLNSGNLDGLLSPLTGTSVPERSPGRILPRRLRPRYSVTTSGTKKAKQERDGNHSIITTPEEGNYDSFDTR